MDDEKLNELKDKIENGNYIFIANDCDLILNLLNLDDTLIDKIKFESDDDKFEIELLSKLINEFYTIYVNNCKEINESFLDFNSFYRDFNSFYMDFSVRKKCSIDYSKLKGIVLNVCEKYNRENDLFVFLKEIDNIGLNVTYDDVDELIQNNCNSLIRCIITADDEIENKVINNLDSIGITNLPEYVYSNPQIKLLLNDDKIINSSFENGFNFYPNYPRAIIENSKWVRAAVEHGQTQAVNYLDDESLNDDDLIRIAFENWYYIDKSSSSAIKRNIKWIKAAINDGQLNVLNYVDNEILNNDEIINCAFKNGYRFYFDSSDEIKNNIKWIKAAIQNGQHDAINYVKGELLYDEDIMYVFEHGYSIGPDSPLSIKNSDEWLKVAIKYGNVSSVNYSNSELLYSDEIINSALHYGYIIDNSSSDKIKGSIKWIKAAVEHGQIRAFDYAAHELLEDDNLIDYAFEKHYEINFSSSNEIKGNIKWVKASIDSKHGIDSLKFVSDELLENDDLINYVVCEKNIKIPGFFRDYRYYKIGRSIKWIRALFENGETSAIESFKNLNYYELIDYLKKNPEFTQKVLLYITECLNSSLDNNKKINGKHLLFLKILKNFVDNETFLDYKSKIINCSKFANEKEEFLKYLDNIFDDNRLNLSLNPINYDNIVDVKNLKFVNKFNCDVSSVESGNSLSCISDEVFSKLNRIHISNVIYALNKITNRYTESLAINIYLVLGYSRALDLINGKYGPVNENILEKMFLNIGINDILFEKEGNGFKPIINTQLINLVFGDSYKINGTPIKAYLNGFEAESEKLKKDKELCNYVSFKDRDEKFEKLDKQFKEFKDNVILLLELNFSKVFNVWDILEEQFLESVAVSSLKLKLNISEINKLITSVDKKRKLSAYKICDEKLNDSDVFDYLLYDDKFTKATVEERIERAIALSSRLEGKNKKKFPNLEVKKGKYTARIYNPQDRRILSAGYRSNCCFRPCGNADDFGRDSSLLNYCVSSEYGCGFEIVDDNGETIMFSPILRNGNVVMIHSIETKLSTNLPDECYDLLDEFSYKIIEEAEKNNDDISFVTITNLHYLDSARYNTSLSEEKKFRIFDDDNLFNGMYNNLSNSHMILAKNKDATFDSIQYGKVNSEYIYENDSKSVSNVSVKTDELKVIYMLNEMKNKYEILCNQKVNYFVKKMDKEAYECLLQIKNIKKEYLQLYKKLIESSNGQNKFLLYNKALNKIRYVNHNLSISNSNIVDVEYGNDWYIAILDDGRVIVNCLESGMKSLQNKIAEYISLKKFSTYEFFNSEVMEVSNERNENIRCSQMV